MKGNIEHLRATVAFELLSICRDIAEQQCKGFFAPEALPEVFSEKDARAWAEKKSQEELAGIEELAGGDVARFQFANGIENTSAGRGLPQAGEPSDWAPVSRKPNDGSVFFVLYSLYAQVALRDCRREGVRFEDVYPGEDGDDMLREWAKQRSERLTNEIASIVNDRFDAWKEARA